MSLPNSPSSVPLPTSPNTIAFTEASILDLFDELEDLPETKQWARIENFCIEHDLDIENFPNPKQQQALTSSCLESEDERSDVLQEAYAQAMKEHKQDIRDLDVLREAYAQAIKEHKQDIRDEVTKEERQEMLLEAYDQAIKENEQEIQNLKSRNERLRAEKLETLFRISAENKLK